MADIVIRGLEMPESCEVCPIEKVVGHEGICPLIGQYTYEDKRNEDCPLIALPEGHGRLIDADATAELLRSLGSRDYRREKGTICEAEKMVRYPEYTPTIVPAADKENVE